MILLIYNILFMNFDTRTKADFIAFDKRREQVFAPTLEEIEEQELLIKNFMIQETKEILASYGIEFTGEEMDFINLYNEYIKGNWEDREKMNAILGNNNEVNRVLADRINNFNTLNDFCLFVKQYN